MFLNQPFLLFDQSALDTYRRQLEAMKQAGIERMLTLHHFTSPRWLADRGGWSSPDVMPRFAQYVDRVARATSDLVRWWITINEPSILAFKAYIEGSWPPHQPWNLRGYVRLLRHAARGHVLARRVLQAERSDALVSMAFAIWPAQAARWWSPIDQALARFCETGCDGVLIGRGAMANPWIFRQIEDTIHGREPFKPTLDDKRSVLLEYFEMLRQDMPEIAAIGRMKQLAGQFTRGLQGGALFRTAIYHSHSVEEILNRISEYFETIGTGRQYFGEVGKPVIEAPSLDSCEAAIAS